MYSHSFFGHEEKLISGEETQAKDYIQLSILVLFTHHETWHGTIDFEYSIPDL